MSGAMDTWCAASHVPTRPTPVTTSSKQTRKPCRSRRSARPRQKRSGGECPGRAAADTGSQKYAATVSGPASSSARSSSSRAASPVGSVRQVAGGRCKCEARYGVYGSWRLRRPLRASVPMVEP